MMFVNVTSVQISEMLTLFFCSWRMFISAAISHPAQEEMSLNYSVQFCEASVTGALIFAL